MSVATGHKGHNLSCWHEAFELSRMQRQKAGMFLMCVCPEEQEASGWVSLRKPTPPPQAFFDWLFMVRDRTNEMWSEHTSI